MKAVNVGTLTALKKVKIETLIREANRKENNLTFGPSIDGFVIPEQIDIMYK